MDKSSKTKLLQDTFYLPEASGLNVSLLTCDGVVLLLFFTQRRGGRDGSLSAGSCLRRPECNAAVRKLLLICPPICISTHTGLLLIERSRFGFLCRLSESILEKGGNFALKCIKSCTECRHRLISDRLRVSFLTRVVHQCVTFSLSGFSSVPLSFLGAFGIYRAF